MDEMEQRIYDVFVSANEDQTTRGFNWYSEYRALLRANSNGFTIEQACGVIGVSSINTNPARGMKWARDFMHGLIERGHLDIAVYRASVILVEMPNATFDEIRDTACSPKVKARKVRNFACNTYTAGAECNHAVACITVDRWANRIARNDFTLGVPSGADYDAVAQAYRNVAAYVNLPVAVLQAITWVVVAEPNGPKN